MADEWKIVPKVWGTELWLTNGPHYCGKQLMIAPGYTCSLHEHPVKDETFLVLQGKGFIQVGTDVRLVRRGDHAHIPPGTPHCFGTNRNSGMLLTEISTHHEDSDVVRHTESRPLAASEIVLEAADDCTFFPPEGWR